MRTIGFDEVAVHPVERRRRRRGHSDGHPLHQHAASPSTFGGHAVDALYRVRNDRKVSEDHGFTAVFFADIYARGTRAPDGAFRPYRRASSSVMTMDGAGRPNS